jgi:purine-binding chemotaxis protein CheW
MANEEKKQAPDPGKSRGKAGKYLTFVLDNEDYGISINNVREIIGMMTITTVPRCPDFIKGVINLRGKVIPIVDLRTRFGMSAGETTDKTCIIVVEINKDNSQIIMGLVVDSVSEVLAIKGEDIEETPSFGTQLDTRYILGMAKLEGGVKILLDIDRVLDSSEMSAVESVT